MKKGIEIPNEILIARNREKRNQYTSCLIKWYRTSMTKEDKFKLGLMGYEEYMEWQEELAEEAARQAELEAMSAAAEELLGEIGNLGEGASESTESEKPATEKKSGNHTFWEDDDGDRENVSKEEFDNFLAQNSIDVSNSTAIDIDSLLSENS